MLEFQCLCLRGSPFRGQGSSAAKNPFFRQFSHPSPTNDPIAEQNNHIHLPNGKTGVKTVVLSPWFGVGLLSENCVLCRGMFVAGFNGRQLCHNLKRNNKIRTL